MKRASIVIAAAAIIVTIAMGVRQAFGLFLPDMSVSLGIGRSSFGLALALQNLLFGLVQPFVGALALPSSTLNRHLPRGRPRPPCRGR